MGLRVRLTPRASADLEDIRAYLAARNRQGAENVRRRIEETIDTIADYPGLGRATDVGAIKVIPVVYYPYLVYYTVTADELVVIHIRHAARQSPGPDEL